MYYGRSSTGFHNTNSQISASLTSNGKYEVSANENSYVYVRRHEGEYRPNRSKGVKVTRAYELFHCQDVSAAIPWPGLAMSDTWSLQDTCGRVPNGKDGCSEVLNEYHLGETNGSEGWPLPSGCSNSPLNGPLSNGENSHIFNRISMTLPEEKLGSATKNCTPRVSVDFSNGFHQNRSASGMVIVTAGLRGEIKTFQNFGLSVQI